MDFLKSNPYLIAIAISVGFFLLELILLKYIQNGKNAKLQKIVNLAKVVQRIANHMIEAETVLGAGAGARKLLYVLHLVQLDCNLLGVDYDANKDGFVAEIEKILDTPQKHSIEVGDEIQVEN